MSLFYSKKNNATSKIADVGGIDGSTNPVTFNITTGEGSKFPSSNFPITIGNEILLCTSRTGDALTCTRAQESTSMEAHSQNAVVEQKITAGMQTQSEDVFDKTKTTSMAEDILLKEQTVAPTTPAAGYAKLHFKSKLPYFLNSDGLETQIPLAANAHSLTRQAIINGNFDIWQRAITATNPAHASFVADRWKIALQFGTPPTNIIHTRQALTPGDIANAYYFYRISPDGAGTPASGDEYLLSQTIEHGVRLLCGLSKKVTVSFWARSSIANKRIGIYLSQFYGNGGTPSALETLNGENWTLTSTWTKYTHTFTTNTLVGKTFGSANDDYLSLMISTMWHSNIASKVGATTTESMVGSGTIDIAQVQLCADDVAIPFQPKSFEDELRACQRYYEKSFNYGTVPGAIAYSEGGNAYLVVGANALNVFRIPVFFKVSKRAAPTIKTWNASGGTEGTTNMNFQEEDYGVTNTAKATGSVYINGEHGFTMHCPVDANYDGVFFGWEARCEL